MTLGIACKRGILTEDIPLWSITCGVAIRCSRVLGRWIRQMASAHSYSAAEA